MNRPTVTYRASRRNLAKAHKLVWSTLDRGFVTPSGKTTAYLTVKLPSWAWEMPKKVRA